VNSSNTAELSDGSAKGQQDEKREITPASDSKTFVPSTPVPGNDYHGQLSSKRYLTPKSDLTLKPDHHLTVLQTISLITQL